MKHEYTISATQGHKIYQKHLVTNEQEELLFQVIGVYSLWSTEIGIRGHWREPRDATECHFHGYCYIIFPRRMGGSRDAMSRSSWKIDTYFK